MAEDNEIKLNICYGCMRKLEEGQQICPTCGYDCNTPQNGEDMLPEGTVLFRKYLVGRAIGRGGFGITYLGYDLDLRLKVAIKEYFPVGICLRSSQSYNVVRASIGEDNAAFSKGCEVFLDEARTLAKISSPNIVHVRDFFREHGTAYIVMDYVEGITLKVEMRKSGGKLPVQRVLALVIPLISQLEQLHRESIIHRDIKPDNLMLVKDPQGEHLVLLDFGSAREYVSKETKSLTSIVTHGFSPLEQYSSIGRQGPYTDVYALCATMYNAITGIVPPPASDRNIDNVPLKGIAESGVSIAPEVETAILHGLALRSENRTRTMGQLLEELNNGSCAEDDKDGAAFSRGEKGTDGISKKQDKEKEESSGWPSERENQGGIRRKQTVTTRLTAAFVAGAVLIAGMYFGFLRKTNDADTKPEASEESVVVSSESSPELFTPTPLPTSTPAPTPSPTPTPTPTPTLTPTPNPTPTPTPVVEEQPSIETVAYENGDTYVGEMKNGLRNGQGTMTYGNDDVYEGEWINDKKNGRGTMTYANGDVYTGDWKADKRSGKGNMSYEVLSGQQSYDGEWKNDLRDGKGIMTYFDGSFYDGDWKVGVKEGEGTMTYADGSTYKGTWINDKYNGQGTMTWTNNEQYIGEWKDNKREGKGVYTYADGSVYDGYWKAGAKNGQGTMTDADGSVQKGEWRDGHFMG